MAPDLGQPRRLTEEEPVYQPRGPVPVGVPLRIRSGVVPAYLGDLSLGPGVVAPIRDRGTTLVQHHRHRVDRGRAEAVARKLHVGHHLGLQVPAHVRARRHPVSREEFLRDARSPDLLIALENENAEALPGEIEGGDQTVVAATDYHAVIRRAVPA